MRNIANQGVYIRKVRENPPPRGWRDGDAEQRVGEGPVGLRKKIVTSPKLGLFLGRKAQEVRQFYCSSECVVVVQVDFF